ncbi:MAG: hypothetical protein AB8G99_22980 [Planctomycetaceae bacterium]
MLSRSLVRNIVLVALASTLCQPFASAQKLKIAQVVWGFDGRVTPNEFNQVSILFDNQGDEAFDGTLRLRKRRGTGQTVGATLAVDRYIAPLGRSWAHFVVYSGTTSDQSDWNISWKGGSEQLPKVQSGQAAIVLLVSPDGLGSSAKGIKHFDESNFPKSVTATQSLQSVVMDHAPRWQAAQRQAFADWIRLGGQLHLLKSDEDEWPGFSEELAILNGPAVTRPQPVGAGVIFRYDLQASDLKSGSKFPKTARAKEETYRLIEAEGSDSALEARMLERTRNASQGYYSTIEYGWDAAERAHSSLIEITQPDHNWLLIFLLAMIYILAIFPGCYLIGRRRVHYVVTYGAILGAALLFSLVFLFVGRRGYGEQTEVNSVAVAQRIDGDRWNVMQWSNAFVTTGDRYELAHSGDGAVYSSGQETERVNGVIGIMERDDDKIGRSFDVDIPPFSNRPYVHRQTVAMPGFDASLQSVNIKGGKLVGAVVDVSDRFQKQISTKVPFKSTESSYGVQAEMESLPIFRIVYRSSVFSMKNDGKGRLILASLLGELDQSVDMNALTQTNFTSWLRDEETTPSQRYGRMFHAMVAHHFGVFKDIDFRNAQLKDDRLRLLIYAPMPKEMFITGEDFANQKGYVLLCQDLLLDTAP